MKDLRKLAIGVMVVMLGLGSPVSSVMGLDTIAIVEAASKSKSKVKLSKSSVSLQVGKNYTVKLNGAGSKKVKWSVSKKSIATITGNGSSCKITAKKAGTTYVTAKLGKKKHKCKVKVKALPASISQKSGLVSVGEYFDLTLKNTKSGVKWSTSDKKVATIKKISKYKYRVYGKKAGKATIIAKVGKKKYTCKVQVLPIIDTPSTEPVKQPETEPSKPSKPETEPSNPETPSKPSEPETQKPTETEDQWGSYLENAHMSKSSLSMVVGDVDSLIMSGAYGGIPFEWSSSNSSVVSISKVTNVKYKVVAMSTGSAVVSARCGNHVYSCQVTVSNRVSPKPPETEPETKPTETPSTEPTTEAPKPNPNPGQPSTEPETETEPETKPQPKLSLSSASKLTVPGGQRIIIYINSSLSADDISYNLKNVNVTYNGIQALDGVLTEKGQKYISFIARLKGEYTVYVSGGGETIEVPVKVTSTDDVWFDYMRQVISMVRSFPGSSDPLEGLKQLGAWLVDNKPYDDGQGRDHKLLFTGDIGLDCIGYSEVFNDVAKRLYNLDADYFTLSSGHTVAQIKIGETVWNFDAGSRGPAGSRDFSCGSKSLSFSYNKSEGWTRLDH